jgi:hypothetical protein
MAVVSVAVRWVAKAVRVMVRACRAWAKARYDHAIQLPVTPSQADRWFAKSRSR